MIRLRELGCGLAWTCLLAGQTPKLPVTDEQQISALVKEWVEAEVKHDEAALNRILDDDFTMVGSNGQITKGKDAFMQKVKGFTFTAAKTAVDLVRIEGDTAIAVGSVTVRLPNGTDGAPQRSTVTFVKRQGRWIALAEQIGNIAVPK